MAAMARAVCAAASSVARSTSAASASSSTSSQSKGWLVYVVETKGGKLYTGITVSLRRRMEQHAGTRTGGAKAFRLDPPARLRYAETAVNRAEATRREMAIKKLRRADKLALIQDAMMLTHDREMIIWTSPAKGRRRGARRWRPRSSPRTTRSPTKFALRTSAPS